MYNQNVRDLWDNVAKQHNVIVPKDNIVWTRGFMYAMGLKGLQSVRGR
jgi:hypothetical protein